MSKYGFDESELFETKVTLIDKDGFHKVGEAGNGSNDGSSNNSGNIFRVYTDGEPFEFGSIQFDHGGRAFAIIESAEMLAAEQIGGVGARYILTYFAEPKQLKTEYETWAEFTNDVGIETFESGDWSENTMGISYEVGEAVTEVHAVADDVPVYYYAGVNAFTSGELGNKVPNFIAIINGENIANPDTGYANGPFKIVHVVGTMVEYGQ